MAHDNAARSRSRSPTTPRGPDDRQTLTDDSLGIPRRAKQVTDILRSERLLWTHENFWWGRRYNVLAPIAATHIPRFDASNRVWIVDRRRRLLEHLDRALISYHVNDGELIFLPQDELPTWRLTPATRVYICIPHDYTVWLLVSRQIPNYMLPEGVIQRVMDYDDDPTDDIEGP